MTEDEKIVLLDFVRRLREYVEVMESAVFAPDMLPELYKAIDKIESEFGL